MKICILSMQKVPNFGSLLQSYSLKRILESLGHEVSFIDIEKNDNDNRLIQGHMNNFNDEKESNLGIWGKLGKLDKYAINRIRVKIRNKVQEDKFEEFRIKVLNIKEDNKKNYDLCIIGSDEVFNCLANTSWGFTTQLFGNVPQARRVITYAASCGATKYENVPEIARKEIKKAFLNVDAFSVRDKNTYKFVNKLTEKNIDIHMDPVIVGDFDKEIAECRRPKELPQHYCIVYSYYNRIHKKEEIEAIRLFCKKKKLEIVSIGAPQMWIKRHLILNPIEVLWAFKEADFIITDTFHGTIFSAKYAQRFATIVRESNRNKLIDLLQRLDKKNHMVKDMSEISRVYGVNNDIEGMKEFTDKERKRAIMYLKENV